MREIDRQDVIPEAEYPLHQVREKVNAGEYQQAMDIFFGQRPLQPIRFSLSLKPAIVTNISISL